MLVWAPFNKAINAALCRSILLRATVNTKIGRCDDAGGSFSQRWVFATELHCDVRPSGTNYGKLSHNGLRTKSAHHCDDMSVS